MTATGSRVEVARVALEHLPALAGFYREVWDPGATAATVQASREEAAAASPLGESPPTWIVLQDGRAIAHVTTIPIVLWLHGSERPAYWIKGLWVLPEFQRTSAGFLVLRAAIAAIDASLALVHEPAAIRLFQALGFADLGALPNELRVFEPRSLLERLDVEALGLDGLPRWIRSAVRVVGPAAPVLAPLLSAANELWAAARTGPILGADVEISARCDAEGADQLWSHARDRLPPGPVRDGAQLIRRYSQNGEYVFVHVRSAGRLAGLGVVKRAREHGDPRLRGIRISTLSDLLYQPADSRTGLAILRGAERAARGLGADALLSSASAAPIQKLLRRRGYLTLPTNLRVLARFPAGEPPAPAALAQWWITRGDSGGDGVF